MTEKPHEEKKRIVLVEDDLVLSQLITARLEREGYEVHASLDGTEGLLLIQREKPDLVLLDILLPGRNGIEILGTLHHDGMVPAMPVIIISNSGQAVDVEQALKYGARDYLVKADLTPGEVLEKVRGVLRGGNPIAGDSEVSSQPLQTAPGHQQNVMIVEDDQLLVDLLTKKFSERGYIVHHAANADEARKLFEKEKISAVLLDIVLPDIDGFTFLDELKNDPLTKEIPIVIVSNLGQREEIERGLKAGAADYVIKAEVLPGEILKRVEKLL